MVLQTSIVIPTFNGGNRIAHLLNALRVQTYKGFEIVVVIDGSMDNTMDVVKDYQHQFRKLKIVNQQNSGRSIARNRGVSESGGDIIIFYDDDMVPAPDSVERHVEMHSRAEKMGLIGGNMIEQENRSNTDIQNYKAHLNLRWMSKYKALHKMRIEDLYFSTANSSTRREDFLALGGFDERMTDAEDYDLAYRALKNNLEVYLDKENHAVHQAFPTASRYIKRLREYNAAHKGLRALRDDEKSAFTSQHKSYFKKITYKLFTSRLLLTWVDKDFFKHMLPRTIRFKVYDIMIQAWAEEFPEKPV